jgi:hypothetical protein
MKFWQGKGFGATATTQKPVQMYRVSIFLFYCAVPRFPHYLNLALQLCSLRSVYYNHPMQRKRPLVGVSYCFMKLPKGPEFIGFDCQTRGLTAKAGVSKLFPLESLDI